MGRCYFYDPSYTTQPLLAVPFSIDDSVGPLIISAVLIERVEPGNDTVLLTFSEPLKDTSLLGNSLILFKNSQKIALNILNFSSRGDTTVFVIEDLKENAPGIYDSIALNSEGPVRDIYGNRAHPDNRPVPFIFHKISGKLTHAYYLDSEADGIVEMAILKFNKSIILSEIKASFSWISTVAATDFNRFSYGQDSTEVKVNLAGAFPQQLIKTSGVMFVNVESIGEQEGQTISVNDSAAPILTSAELHPGIPAIGTKPPDTLICGFSEAIQEINCENPFLFSSVNSGQRTEYQMSLSILSNSRDQWVFTINEIKGVDYPQNGDSVWIDVSCGISDTVPNKQEDQRNHRVLLKVNTAPVVYDIKIGPNPIYPLYSGSAAVIKIEPSLKLKQFVKFNADISIFDPVGNIVFKDYQESQNFPAATIYFRWNGRNRNGRIVGKGVYLAIVKVYDLSKNSAETKYFNIGVAR